MFYRSLCFRCGNIGILLLCVGTAILGTGVADYIIRAEDARRRSSFALPPFTPEIPPFMVARAFPIGSPAPDFVLPNALDGREIHLAEFCNHKPVILLFGSFGCDIFCGQLARLNKLHQAYKDRVEFLFVYITDGPHQGLLPPPTPTEQNLGHIPRGLRHFNISFPCLLGDKAIEAAYTAFPERLLIVDRAGRIVLDAGLGLPSGWDLDRVESWLKRI